MSEVLEVNMFASKLVTPAAFVELLETSGRKVTLRECELFSNWEYEDHTSWVPADVQAAFQELQEGILISKIAQMHFLVDDRCTGGYAAYKVSPDQFELSVWINTSGLESLQGDEVGADNRSFYDQLTKTVGQVGKQHNFTSAYVGLETSVEFSEDLVEMMRNSHNVFRWILPARPAWIPPGFEVQEEEGDWVVNRLPRSS
ncbi:hypothetical protein [Tumebacillus flagellatus]|uniref:Uncharacterized protein n=1 Tax=Tumebacillus flagellatus TaxID=1157490 RepID=A0A074LKE1_9BACL|nr:hypothetical protein [Tumebacillus flagellatus]KEO81055.1 hypothetical protein EL26_22725 [Tumebacillus flagellatus]